MLIIDRVVCDLCAGPMGQLHHQPAPQADKLPDLRSAPHFTVCPDCWAASTPVQRTDLIGVGA